MLWLFTTSSNMELTLPLVWNLKHMVLHCCLLIRSVDRWNWISFQYHSTGERRPREIKKGTVKILNSKVLWTKPRICCWWPLCTFCAHKVYPEPPPFFLRIIELWREFVKSDVLRGIRDVRTSTRYTSIRHFRFWHRINCKILSEVSKKSLSFHCYAKHKLLLLRHQTRTSYDRHARSKKHRNPKTGAFWTLKHLKSIKDSQISKIFW